MKNLAILVLPIMLIITSLSYGQQNSRKTEAKKVIAPPVIDGILENLWFETDFISDFIQYKPYNGQTASMKTEVAIVYDNDAIYIGAKLYDTSPDSIFKILTQRDDYNTSDYFGVFIDPFNDGLNAYGFFVTAAGVQVDKKNTDGTEDLNWDAVWKSGVKIISDGWIVEMRIPFSAIRFPENKKQTWSINFYRNIQRYREISTWNYINNNFSGINNQSGFLDGITEIVSPLRLSVIPYFSVYSEKTSEKSNLAYQYKGGLDLKYGISKSFTLDMMLIPDFGQTVSDDEVLNLSPYETYYAEKRYFFTEGTELFNKGNILYSRRIGGKPKDYSSVDKNLDNNEIIQENPIETQIINATKISGKTKTKTGIGFLNAITLDTWATVEDTAKHEKRRILTQPLTNYNMLALSQALPNNSSTSICNTNVFIPEHDYKANVTAGEVKIINKQQSYSVYIQGSYSIQNDTVKKTEGVLYQLGLNKIKGKFRYGIQHKVITDKYNPNDMGYLNTNNQYISSASISYNLYNPFWKCLNLYNTLSISRSSLYLPRMYINDNINLTSSTTFKNHLSAGIKLIWIPKDTYNYFESRVDNRVFIQAGNRSASYWISSDYRKPLAIDLNSAINSSNDQKQYGYSYGIAPRLRLFDNLLIVYSYSQQKERNSYGYISKTSDSDTIFFGKRNISTLTNSLTINYIFNKNSSLSLKARHYWSIVDYRDYYTLHPNGRLKALPVTFEYNNNCDINYNILNLDLVYSWQFAPGSEFMIVYKHIVQSSDVEIIRSYSNNFEMFYESPRTNSISMKFQYYLDYQHIKRKL